MLYVFCNAQTRAYMCNCQAYFNWDTIKKQGLLEDSIYNKLAGLDTINDDGCDAVFLISKDSGNYFQIVPFYDNPAKKLPPIWIKKTGQVDVSGWPITGSTSLLYETPDSASLPIDTIKYKKWEVGVEYIVLNCKGSWLKVEFYSRGKLYKGWVNKHTCCPWPCLGCN